MSCDLLVIGDDHHGIDRAISAARAGRRVTVIRPEEEAVSFDLIRAATEQFANASAVSMASIRIEAMRLIRSRSVAQRAEMKRLGIEQLTGEARFQTDCTLELTEGTRCRRVQANEIIVACGTKSRQPNTFAFDRRVLVAESLLQLDEIPRSSIVIGAGATGMAVAILLAKLAVEVTVVDEHANFLDLCGTLTGRLDQINSLPIAFRLGDEAIGTTLRSDGRVTARLASGRGISAETILVCVGRVGKTEKLNLEAAGVGIDERGRLWCDAHGQTWAPNIVAVGDVVGFQAKPRQTVPPHSPSDQFQLHTTNRIAPAFS